MLLSKPAWTCVILLIKGMPSVLQRDKEREMAAVIEETLDFDEPPLFCDPR
jgi:hypothetical protein